jgi:hypothetical protein
MWTQSNATDTGEVTKILGQLAKQRAHYGKRTMKELKDYLAGNTEVECWVYDGADYAVGILLMHNAKILNKGPSHWIANAWFDGNITATAAMDLMIEKTKDYCTRNNATTICHIHKKDLQGRVAELNIQKPYRDNLHYSKLKESFAGVTIEERKRDFVYVLTL